MVFQPEVEFHNHPFEERQFIVLAQVFLHYHKLEVAHGTAARQALITTDDIHFLIGHQVFHHFTEHQVDPGLHTESKAEVHPDDIVGNDMFHYVFAGIRIIHRVDMHKPVNIGAFRFSIQNRVDDLVLNLFRIIGTGHIHQVRGIFRDRFIIAELLDLGNIMLQPDKFHVPVFDLAGAVPDIHDEEHHQSDDQGDITTMGEFHHQRHEVADFHYKIGPEKDIYPDGFGSLQDKIIGIKHGGGQHGHNDGKTISRFHIGGLTEKEHHANTTQEHQEIDCGNKKLSFGFRWITDPEFGPEVKPHGFTDQGKSTGDHGLAGNNGRYSGNKHPGDNKPLGHQVIKSINTKGALYFRCNSESGPV